MDAKGNKLACFKGADLKVPGITDDTVAHFIMRTSEQLAPDDKIAYVEISSDNRTVAYGEFRNKVFRLSHALVRRGYGEGDVACIHCCNMPEFVIVLHAAVAAGMAVTLCNSLYTSYEVAHQLKDSNSVVIFAQADQAIVEKCVKACYDNNNAEGPDTPSPTSVKEIITLSAEKTEISADSRGLKVMHYLGLLTPDTAEFNKKLPSVKIDWKTARALIPYSSGTTGLSKGVALTNYNVYYQIHQIMKLIHLEPSCDVFLPIPPLYHIYGTVMAGLTSPFRGITTLMQQRFDFPAVLKGIQDYKVTKLALVPPIMLALAKHPMVDKFDLSSVNEILSGAAPQPAEQIQIACERINPNEKIVFTQGYGMTESGGVSSGLPPDAPYECIQKGSVGIPVAGCEIKIMNIETGETELCGVEGEVCMRAPSLMQCYLNREEETKNTIMSDGWLRSGDLGYMNEEGYLWITDRLKELIKYKGNQVPPAQLEAVILTHPSVQDCAVIGIPDESAGELPRAYVKVKESFEGKVTEGELQAFVKERVAPFKQLKGGVAFIDAIPKSGAGKILRKTLKDSYLNEQKQKNGTI